ncbi:MAG: ribosomal-processing cysteine protease Prp [Clostridiales bacterium]|nr:ribosomal-processing cysteine protease Prp [Clostridiales bacterium]
MTVIRMLGERGCYTGFEVSGHADAGDKGYDIVCAAISFLATTCANALESVANVQVEAILQDGYLKAEAAQANDTTQIILRTFYQGANDLSQTYPKHVRLIELSN